MAEGEVGDLGHALNLHCVHCLRPTKWCFDWTEFVRLFEAIFLTCPLPSPMRHHYTIWFRSMFAPQQSTQKSKKKCKVFWKSAWSKF